MAAYLEDQLQEQKMKKSLQEKYMNDSTELFVYQGQKLNSYIEKQLEDEIEASVCVCVFYFVRLVSSFPANAADDVLPQQTLKKKLTEEEKAHGELEAFFKNSQTVSERRIYITVELFWIVIGQKAASIHFP